MRYSQYMLPTLKEDPAEAEVISHRLMFRAGMIRKLAAGIYSYLPLGLRVIQKVERIIREEMNRAGAQEVLLPCVHPADAFTPRNYGWKPSDGMHMERTCSVSRIAMTATAASAPPTRRS